jgi:drug/metabolite transporter (DMT)-like permease
VHQPIITGALFFAAQIFTFSAIRVGDVSLQTPIMGTKAVFAVILAAICGTEVVGLPMFAAAFVAMLGVGFIGFSGNGIDKVAVSIALALLSSLFFAGSDTMVGFYAGNFGVPAFLFIAFLTNALLSFGLIPFFKEPLSATPKNARPWILVACILMGVQALLLNYTLGRYQHVAEVNVLYSMRGLWSVVFGALAARIYNVSGQIGQRRIYILRFVGAFLMCVAIAILFYP